MDDFLPTRVSCPPVILSLSGHDPTGGAGIQADIEAIRALGGHPCTVITALTAQDSEDVAMVYPQDPDAFEAQCSLLLSDFRISAIKIGLLGSHVIARRVAKVIDQAGSIPVVLDPVLAAGGGTDLAGDMLLAVIRHEILPRSTWVTPNVPEVLRLGGSDSIEACVERLRNYGAQHILVTGTHAAESEVVNRWFGSDGVAEWRWARLPESYHGSGCTLAAALAAGVAGGLSDLDAVVQAQTLTYRALSGGYPLGRGQWFPRRCEVMGG